MTFHNDVQKSIIRIILISDIEKCAICLTSSHVFYRYERCSCNYYYHYECLTEWFVMKEKILCPICKKGNQVEMPLDKIDTCDDTHRGLLMQWYDGFLKLCESFQCVSMLVVLALLDTCGIEPFDISAHDT